MFRLQAVPGESQPDRGRDWRLWLPEHWEYVEQPDLELELGSPE